jgi:hypothetical protein
MHMLYLSECKSACKQVTAKTIAGIIAFAVAYTSRMISPSMLEYRFTDDRATQADNAASSRGQTNIS